MRKRTALFVAVIMVGTTGFALGHATAAGGSGPKVRDFLVNGTITKSKSGEELRLFGSGVFNSATRDVTGGGMLVHRAKDGSVLGRGFWQATKVVSWKSYGTGEEQTGSSLLEGGRLVLQVIFNEGGATTPYSNFVISCKLGSSTPSYAVEGIKVGPFTQVEDHPHAFTLIERL